MEQSVNTFQDGLQLDSHPMVQSNTSLSNALNATFITMNGNEVILQNDMGNRRIDEAYLPAGYVPVGIKEYGGIIYVAAHNPLTHTDQIGSFPSPERNIGEEYPELSTTIKDDFKDYFKSTSIEKPAPYKDEKGHKVYLTNVESKLLPLAENRILHAGDKFTVYFIDNDNENIEPPSSFKVELISNYNTTNDHWNKQYTLYLGVLNAQNQFVDITKSLERWKNDGTIIDTSNLSEEEKFNTGYFIPILGKKMSIDTKDDSEYLRNRETKAVNTYAYKLVGPLSLKIGLNTPQNFDYEIRGETRSDGSYYVRITGTITYNCPNPMFDFYGLNSECKKEPTPNISEDKINNLKTATIVKEYKITSDNLDSKNYEYHIGVRTFNDDTDNTNNYYLEKFWNTGTLDLTLFGSGNAQLTGWRFYNNWDEESDDAECYLSCNMVAYPKLDEEISNLEIAFSEDPLYKSNRTGWNNQLWTTLSPLVGKVGMFKSSWKELGNLQPQTLYYVHFRYKSTDTDSENWYSGHKYVINATRFLTTNLFNPCYTLGSDDFVSNFNEFFNESDNPIINKYKTINIYPNFQIKLDAIKKSTNSSNLQLVRQSNQDFVFDAKTTYNISGSILNEELVYDSIKYPKDEVTINSTDSSITYNTKFSFKFNDSITSEKKGDDSLTIAEIKLPSLSDVTSKKFEITPELLEHFKSKVTNNFTLNNIFCTIEDAIKSQENSDDYKYSEFMLSFHPQGSGDKDEKRIDLLCLPKKIDNNWKIEDNPAQTLKLYGNWGQKGISKNITQLNEQYFLKVDNTRNDTNSYQVEYDQDIVNELSRKISLKNQNFSYLFISPNDFNDIQVLPNKATMYDGTLIFAQEKNPDRYLYTTAENCSLLFWRNAGDTWAIYPTLLSKTGNKSSLITQLGQKITGLYYAYKLEEEYSDSKYYIPDLNNYIYNNSYSVDLTIGCSISYNPGETSVSVTHRKVFTSNIQKSKTLSTTVTLKVDTLEQILPIIFNQPYSNIIAPEKGANGGKFLDYRGNTLNPQEIYYCKDNNFYKLQNNKSFRVGMIDSDSEYRLLFPYSVIPGGHQYKYMITGQGTEESTNSNHTVRLRLSQNVDITNKIQPFNDLIAGAVPTNLYNESTTVERNLHTHTQAILPNNGNNKIIDNYIYYNNEIIIDNSNNNIISNV